LAEGIFGALVIQPRVVPNPTRALTNWSIAEPAALALLSAGVALLGVRLVRRCYRLTA